MTTVSLRSSNQSGYQPDIQSATTNTAVTAKKREEAAEEIAAAPLAEITQGQNGALDALLASKMVMKEAKVTDVQGTAAAPAKVATATQTTQITVNDMLNQIEQYRKDMV